MKRDIPKWVFTGIILLLVLLLVLIAADGISLEIKATDTNLEDLDCIELTYCEDNHCLKYVDWPTKTWACDVRCPDVHGLELLRQRIKVCEQ